MIYCNSSKTFYWSKNLNATNNRDDMRALISYIIGFTWKHMIMRALHSLVDYINLMMCASWLFVYCFLCNARISIISWYLLYRVNHNDIFLSRHNFNSVNYYIFIFTSTEFDIPSTETFKQLYEMPSLVQDSLGIWSQRHCRKNT